MYVRKIKDEEKYIVEIPLYNRDIQKIEQSISQNYNIDRTYVKLESYMICSYDIKNNELEDCAVINKKYHIPFSVDMENNLSDIGKYKELARENIMANLIEGD